MDAATDRGGMPLDLFLVRHGQSEGNVALEAADDGDGTHLTDDFRGRNASDWRLSSHGCTQAAAAGGWIRRWLSRHTDGGFDRYYCSPYVRTRETAALLGLPGAQWQLESLLRERDFGLWAGVPKPEAEELFPETWAEKQRHKFLWRPEGGESTADLDMRVRDLLATLAREMAGRRVICVTHEDTMRAFRFRLERMTVEEWLERERDEQLDMPNCGILHYTRRSEDGAVAGKFTRVRLVDPTTGDDAPWIPIQRRKFSNEELLEQIEAHVPLVQGGGAL
ncbi:MAG: histidine phosphatase family protein [Microthrixaceae bacterium]